MKKDAFIFIDKLQREFGLSLKMGIEFEFYFSTKYKEIELSNIRIFSDLQELFNSSLVAIEEEDGVNQFEVIINYGKPREISKVFQDSIFKLKKYAQEKGNLKFINAAKPFADRPGNGMHFHLSLVNKLNKNEYTKNNNFLSNLLLFSIGGLCHFMIYDFTSFAPNENSYKRFFTGSYFSSEQVPEYAQYVSSNVSWGVNNRTTALRIIKDKNNCYHIEHRISGSDCDLEAVIFAISRAIYWGIFEQINPPKQVMGNSYDREYSSLIPFPKSLFGALKKIKQLSLNFEKYKKTAE
ncbi:hypothetical protein Q4Q35_03545 [Flavivirga aquimarina]|uniref:GS catalytic domain-containing protein n=1 Tax=Flavivirga aquimarina TaxID=2027862 RepID=A0ABT8W6Y2_9FLAO|nr:hypothetical protein [Flavivirga aquimarina]MDO5968871.1 hypothetical protein [Flavivirga aquimarina]